MSKAKKHVEFSESVKGENDGDDLLKPHSSKRISRTRSRLGGIFIPAHRQSGSDLSPPVVSPSPFSPAIDSARERRTAGDNQKRALELGEPTGDDFIDGDNRHKWYGKKDKLAPETAITLFAFRLAILEKLASTLGTVAFLWATVVLLGGFATTATITDFWVVSLLLFTEGVRIFGRSHELEWQHVASKATITLTSSAKRATTQMYKIGSDAMILSSRVVRTAFHSLIHKPEDAEHGVDPALLHSQSDVQVREAAIPTMQKSSSAPPTQLPKFTDRTIMLLKYAAAMPGGHPVQIKRTWSSNVVPFLPYARHSLFSSQAISLYLYWLQIASASTSVALSIWRLWKHDFTDAETEMSLGEAVSNLVVGLVLFYGLALAESFIFLFERAYWELKVTYENLLVKVSEDYNLPSEMQSVVKDFFYEVYRKSLDGSIFDGLEMDLVSFAIQMVQCDSSKLQLQGSQLLIVFVKDPLSAEDTLRRIGSSPGMFDRLIEMLSWHNENEEQIRTAAAEIVCRLVIFNRNTFRIAGIAGAVEGIVCLLKEHDLMKGADSLDTTESAVKLRLLGLRILKYLSRDPNNRARIGATRGFLPTLVTFIRVQSKADLDSAEAAGGVRCFKKSLQLLVMMASAPGHTGEQLRTSILQVLTVVRNIRDILQYGSEHPGLQKYAIDLLTYLAMDDNVQVRESLGSTGGLIRNLLALLLVKQSWLADDSPHPDVQKPEDTPLSARQKEEIALAVNAGEALNLLALKNATNCRRMISVMDLESWEPIPTLRHLLDLVSDPHLGATASKILRSFCQYAGPEGQAQIAAFVPVAFTVLRRESDKYQEAALGLAAKSLQVMLKVRKTEDVPRELDHIFLQMGMDKKSFVQELILLLPPKTHLPRLRRHVVELMNALMESDTSFVTTFREAGLERKLHLILDTIWDIENFYIFSGNTGLSRHEQDMENLVLSALAHLGPPIWASSRPSAP